MNFEDRIRGMMMGAASGDAFGYPVEFMSVDEIDTCFTVWDTPPVNMVYSDDTQLALSTSYGILNSELGGNTAMLSSIWAAYQAWNLSQSDHTNRRAPGATCLRALGGGKPGSVDFRLNDSKGNGGLMRVHPLAILPDEEQAFTLAIESSAMTHGHVFGFVPSGWLVSFLWNVLRDMDVVDAFHTAQHRTLKWAQENLGISETEQVIEFIMLLDEAYRLSRGDAITPCARMHKFTIRKDSKYMSQGAISEECLAMALFAALRGVSFPDAMIVAANIDGDSDTVATVAGAIYGAICGIQNIPHEWQQFRGNEEVAQITERLIDTRVYVL